jgi:hypothetical protein
LSTNSTLQHPNHGSEKDFEESLVCCEDMENEDLDVEVLEGGTESVPISDDPRLPIHPFFMMLVGPRKQGKSNAALDFIFNKIPDGFFDMMIVYCKTIEDDDKWKPVLESIPREFIHLDLDENSLRKEFNTVSMIRKKDPNFKTLMIFDDMIQETAVHDARYRNSFLNKLATMGRHKGISVIFTTQLYKALSTAIRNNTTNLLVFYQQDVSERDKIMEANRGELSKDQFLEVYHIVHADPEQKNFLHINKDQKGPLRFTKNWSSPVVLNHQVSKVQEMINKARADMADHDTGEDGDNEGMDSDEENELGFKPPTNLNSVQHDLARFGQRN